jgi:hypothetical protein
LTVNLLARPKFFFLQDVALKSSLAPALNKVRRMIGAE